MSAARPTATEERWRVLAERYPSLRPLVQRRPEAGRWRYATLLSRSLFFVLGLFAAGLSYGLIDLVGVPLAGFVTGLALSGVAEGLIRRGQLFASGIEEALWSAGAAMIAFELVEQWRPIGDVAGLLLVASVLVLAGWRLLNPLLITLAAVLASGSLARATSRGGLFEDFSGASAGAACFGLAFVALAIGARRFERPSHDRMLDWLVVAMPVVGFGWMALSRAGPVTLQTLRDGSLPALLPLLLVSTFGLAALATGLRRRTHAPLCAALAAVPLLAWELRAVTGLAPEWRLILWGGLGLGVAIGLERALRSALDGLTSRDLGEPDAALELAQLGSVAVATPSSGGAGPGSSSPAVEGQGGSFAGGGASGRY